MPQRIFFPTTNDGKFQEMQELLDRSEFDLIRSPIKLRELQTENMEELLRDKVLKAYAAIGRPLIVDHTGLEFELLKGFPAGLTDVFYERLKSEGIASVIGNSSNTKVKAITLLGYFDGRQIHTFRGEARGDVAGSPRGTDGFQWDDIFVPEGQDKTYAELGSVEKNKISMRRVALNEFAAFMRGA